METRKRNFAFILYPESMNPQAFEIIDEWHIPVLISPLHDKDINPFGEVKKPHYHVIIAFNRQQSIETVQDMAETLITKKTNKDSKSFVVVVKDLRSYARYLCHLDNPSKHQYNIDDVGAYGGIDYNDIISCTSDKYVAIAEMIDYIEANDIVCYADLLQIARSEHYSWFKSLCDNSTMVIKEYLKSRFWKKNSTL